MAAYAGQELMGVPCETGTYGAKDVCQALPAYSVSQLLLNFYLYHI